jgi:hypothetical protein
VRFEFLANEGGDLTRVLLNAWFSQTTESSVLRLFSSGGAGITLRGRVVSLAQAFFGF